MRESLARVLLAGVSGVRVPGIVRREAGSIRPGFLPIGFSDPFTSGGERLRIAAFARSEDILRATTPYEVASLPVPDRSSAMQALAAAKERASFLDLPFGVWGSAAIELYTGLPCTGRASDLDLIVGATAHLEKLSSFAGEVACLERDFHLRIDVEVDLPCGYGVQLKELLGGGRTVLGKGLKNVALLPRSEVLTDLALACRPARDAL